MIALFPDSTTLQPGHRNRRNHHRDIQVYRGPFLMPAELVLAIATAPTFRTTDRHNIRRVVRDGVTFLARERVALSAIDLPDEGSFVGEVTRGQNNNVRVHIWSIAEYDPQMQKIETIIAIAKEENND